MTELINKNIIWAKLSYIKQSIVLNSPKIRSIKNNFQNYFHDHTFTTDIDKIRFIRNWVNTKSVHKIDKEHNLYAFKINKVLEKLWLTHNNIAEKPHLSCGPRSYAMMELLKLVNIRSRIIDIFQVGTNLINPHTLVEVYSNDINKWIMQDPDFNTEYIDSEEFMEPLSAKEALLINSTLIQYNSNELKVENEINCKNTIKNCFNCCVLYRNSYTGKRSEFIIKDPEDLNIIVQQSGSSLSFNDFIQARGHSPLINTL